MNLFLALRSHHPLFLPILHLRFSPPHFPRILHLLQRTVLPPVCFHPLPPTFHSPAVLLPRMPAPPCTHILPPFPDLPYFPVPMSAVLLFSELQFPLLYSLFLHLPVLHFPSLRFPIPYFLLLVFLTLYFPDSQFLLSIQFLFLRLPVFQSLLPCFRNSSPHILWHSAPYFLLLQFSPSRPPVAYFSLPGLLLPVFFSHQSIS